MKRGMGRDNSRDESGNHDGGKKRMAEAQDGRGTNSHGRNAGRGWPRDSRWRDGHEPSVSPRDQYLTVYGRNPVLEALADRRLRPVRLVIAEGARGEAIARIVRAARSHQLLPDYLPAHRVSLLSGNGRQDQGVMLDVSTPALGPLTDWLARSPAGPALLLDGLTNPANVGMIIRSAAAAGCAVVVPRRGVAELGPLVVKASSGVLFTATVARHATARGAAEELVEAGFTLVGLRGHSGTPSMWEETWPDRCVLVIGGEKEGVSPEVSDLVAWWRRIPMANGVESLNAAVAASVACFDLCRGA